MTELRSLLPDEGWLGDWMAYGRQTMASPPEFVFGAGLAALSAAVGSRIRFPLGAREWFPHVWVLLLGPAGAIKSTPTAATIRAVRHARSEPDFPTRFSPEGFFEALEERPDALWSIGEIDAFLGQAGRDYMAGMRAQLCDVWDGMGFSRRLKRKKDSIEVPAGALTAIATGRITDFQRAAGLADFRSGMMSRFLVCTSAERGAYRGLAAAMAGDGGSEGGGGPLLRARLRTIADGLPDDGIMASFDAGGVALWDRTDEGWRTEEASEELDGWAKRRGIQALKLAILRAVSRCGGPVVRADDVAWAIAVVRAIYADLERLVEEVGAGDRDSERRERAWATIRRLARDNGAEIPIRDVYRALWRHGSARDVEGWIESLEKAGMVTTEIRKPPVGRPSKVVRIVNGSVPVPLTVVDTPHGPYTNGHAERVDTGTELVTELPEESPW